MLHTDVRPMLNNDVAVPLRAQVGGFASQLVNTQFAQPISGDSLRAHRWSAPQHRAVAATRPQNRHLALLCLGRRGWPVMWHRPRRITDLARRCCLPLRSHACRCRLRLVPDAYYDLSSRSAILQGCDRGDGLVQRVDHRLRRRQPAGGKQPLKFRPLLG